MIIRQAIESDAESLATLIFASGPETLAAVLDIDSKLTALNFLSTSLAQPDGQYGYLNHWVAIDNQDTVACVSAWHNQLSASFHQATMNSILAFYGVENTHLVIRNSVVTQDCIPKPTAKEWCVGHLSVAPKYQGQGYGKALLALVEQQGIAAKKHFLSLDVAVNNPSAIKFYESQGFVKDQKSIMTDRMKDMGIGIHFHLIKALAKPYPSA